MLVSTSSSSTRSGNAWCMRSSRLGSQVCTIVSTEPSRSRPTKAFFALATSIMSYRVCNMRSAYASSACPRTVRRTPRVSRSNSRVPSACSSCAMRCEIAGWLVCSLSAAARKPPSVATQ